MASDVQLAAALFPSTPPTFDVSEVAYLRKRVGRASASLKFIGVLLGIVTFLGGITSVGLTVSEAASLLVGWGVFSAANRLRSGSTGAAIVAAIVWLLLAGFNAFVALPASLRNGINGFSVLGMVVLVGPLYFLGLGLIVFTKDRRRASTGAIDSGGVGLQPWEPRLPVNTRPKFVNRTSTAAYMFLVLSPLPWLFLLASAINRNASMSPDSAERAGQYTSVILIHAAVWVGVARLYRHARREAMVSGTDLEKRDPRKPILYLRSFHDDRAKLWARATDGRIFLERFVRITFEELVTDHLWAHGPVVGIADPTSRNKTARLGAARDGVEDQDWQRKVIDSMQRASVIVAIAGNTPGLVWEIETIMRLGFGPKLILLMPPVRMEELRSRWQFLVRSIRAVDLPAGIDLIRTRAVLWQEGHPILLSGDGRNDWTYEAVLDEAVLVLRAHHVDVPGRVFACPRCNTAQRPAGYPTWALVVSVCLFPFGLVALLVGRKPTRCANCGFEWRTSLQVDAHSVTCPNCDTSQKRAGYPKWAIVVSVCVFPFGLLALLTGRRPTTCVQCGRTWKA